MSDEMLEELKVMYPEVDVEVLKRHYGVNCGD